MKYKFQVGDRVAWNNNPANNTYDWRPQKGSVGVVVDVQYRTTADDIVWVKWDKPVPYDGTIEKGYRESRLCRAGIGGF